MSLDKYCNEIKFDNSKKNKDQFLTRDDLIQNNLRLVVKIAHQYKQYAPIEDLIQEGNIGLIKAADRIDRTKKNKFITYASFYIKNEMFRFMKNNYLISNGIGKNLKIIHGDDNTNIDSKNISRWDAIYAEAAIKNHYNSPLSELEDNEITALLNNAINKLSPIEQDIINNRFLKDKNTLKKLAKKWNCTIPNIHILEKKALKKLRKFIENS